MEDRDIVNMFLCRNPDAIDETSHKYGNYCHTIAQNILFDIQDTEECINESYFKLWNTIPPQVPVDLASFLGRIVRNTAFNRYRYNHAQKRGGNSIVLVLDELSECVCNSNAPEKSLERKELAQTLNQFIAQLSPWKRYVLLRRYWYTDSVSDIAKKCGKTESYISMTLTRLRRKLREYLQERSIDP